MSQRRPNHLLSACIPRSANKSIGNSLRKSFELAKQQRQERRRRRLRTQLFEQLEPRIVLASDWRNPARPLDVNNDLLVTPLDILLVVLALRLVVSGRRFMLIRQVAVLSSKLIGSLPRRCIGGVHSLRSR